MIVETHCHTSEHSRCSHVAAVDLVRRACEAGIQTIVLTDHHYQWSEEELADLRRRAQLPEICRILAGQEVDDVRFRAPADLRGQGDDPGHANLAAANPRAVSGCRHRLGPSVPR